MEKEDLVIGMEYTLHGDVLNFSGFDRYGYALFECDHNHPWETTEGGLIIFDPNGMCIRNLNPITK